MAPPSEPARLERLPAFSWFVIAVVALSVFYTVINVGFVRPYLWPAGIGATYTGDTSADVPLKARPPDVRQPEQLFVVTHVAPGGPAESAGVRPGDRLLGTEGPTIPLDHGRDFVGAPPGLPPLMQWRDSYWTGVSGPIVWRLDAGTEAPR